MKKQHEIVIDKEKCVGCGLCQKDCVAGAISIKEHKAEKTGAGCISCGHCESVCPQNAVTITGFAEEPEEFEEQTRLNPEELMMAIKTRRSVRVFEEKAVPVSVIKQIIEVGRLAPTGGNAQDTVYYVLESKKDELEAIAVSMFRNLTGPLKKVLPFLKNMNFDDDFFFKKAPLVIVLTGNSVNASLAAENMAFMAEAHGLGVLYSGFFTMCVNHSKKIRKAMQMPGKRKAVTTLVIGYPAVKYHRTARREKAKVVRL